MGGTFMETIQKSSEELLGEYGEKLVVDYLKSKGHKVNHISIKEKYHPYDFEVNYKGEILLCDVKTKMRRESYDDTGIDLSCYYKFKNYVEKDKKRVFLFFVDFHDNSKKIYFLDFNEYYKRNSEHNMIVYWNLNLMKDLRVLTEEEVNHCKKFRQSKFIINKIQ